MTIAHPAWCSPAHCAVEGGNPETARGEHRSAPARLDILRAFTNRGPVEPVDAFLTRAQCPWGTETYLHLGARAEDMTIPVEHATAALKQLTDLINQAEEATA